MTVIAAVVASGEALPPILLFDTKTVKESHLRYCDREVILKGTGTGWSSSEIFVEWVEQVLVPRLNPLCNPYNKIVLFLDGSRTHLGVRGLTVCKKAGVPVVLFPSHTTDRIQPLDRALFRGVKCRYRQLQNNFIKSNLGRSPGVARFVSFAEQAWYQTVSSRQQSTNSGDRDSSARSSDRPDIVIQTTSILQSTDRITTEHRQNYERIISDY